MKKFIYPINNIFYLLLLLFVSITSVSFSQTAPSQSSIIKGVAVDSLSKETIPYTTISLSAFENPSIYLKRIASDVNGKFVLNLTTKGDYILCLESVGMKKYIRNISITSNQETFNLGKIYMSTSNKNLTEVTVLASKPLVKVDLDKISYDAKSDPEALSINVLDMLRKVPLVTVDGEDKIQLKGMSNFRVFVNGKESGMINTNPSQALKNMQASSVKRIEVITEPGAKYDAEGIGGIINIITDSSLEGIEGTVRTGLDSRGSYNEGVYLSTKIGKFGLTTNLNYNNQNDPRHTWSGERENLNPQLIKYINQTAFSNSNSHYAFGNLEASYEFDSLNLVSLTVGGFNGGNSSTDLGNTISMNSQRNVISAFNQVTYNTQTWGNVELSLDYQRSFKKPEKFLTFSYKLMNIPSTRDNKTELISLKNIQGYSQNSLFDATGNEHTFQVDYTVPFYKKHVFEMGAKYIIRLNQSKNNYLLQDSITDLWKPITSLQNKNLDETEHIRAIYGSYALKLGKFSIRTGLRIEQTQLNVQLTDTTFQLHYENWVPSIALFYKFSNSSNLKLSYNQRISRPGIWYLNPFKDNSNPYSIYQGNPNLKPELAHSISLNYSLFTSSLTLNANLFGNTISNSIENITSLLNDSVQYSTYKNIGFSQTLGLSLNINWQANKFFRLTMNGNFDYKSLKANNSSGMQNDGEEFYFYVGNELRLPGDTKLNAGGGCFSPQINLQGTNSPFYYYYISFSHDFLKKKLNVSLSANNPFVKTIIRTDKIETSDFRLNNTSTNLAQRYSINISYRFGKLKNRIKKVEHVIVNDDVKGKSNGL